MTKRLADYLQYMEATDVLAATERAKTDARTLLEDQGIAVLALMLADVLADVIRPEFREAPPVAPADPPAAS